MNRRYFIGTAVAGAATAAQSAAANDKINVAIVGVGGRGRGLLSNFAQLPDVNVTVLCDPAQDSMERASAVVSQLGIPKPKTTNDLRKVLDDPDVDAISVATPDHWHAPAAILAANAGKHVYVEKPASHNVREGRLMVDAARHNKRIMQVGTQARSRPSTRKAIELAHSGAIGDILMAKAWNIQLRENIGHKPDTPVPPDLDYDTWLGPAPWIPFNENRFHYKWHWHWHFGTGDAGNDGAHQLDIARWALQRSYPKTISGMGRKVFFDDDQQTPDTMNVTFDYGDRAMIWEMRIWNPYPMHGIENGVAVYGTDGEIHIGPRNGRWGYALFDRKGRELEHDEDEHEDDAHQRNFIDSIKSGKLPSADIGIGHLSTLHCHLANIVSRVNRTIHFDAETETIIDDPEANLHVSRRYRRHWATPKRV